MPDRSDRAAPERTEIPQAIRGAFEGGDGRQPAAPPAALAQAGTMQAVDQPVPAKRSMDAVLDEVAYWSCPPRPAARVHWVGAYAHYRHPADLWAEILSNLENLVVIDARFAEAYAREHIPGAISMPFKTINATSVAGLPRDATLVSYCWNNSCHASSKAADRLRALGFEVVELHGGLETWKRLGYPTERG